MSRQDIVKLLFDVTGWNHAENIAHLLASVNANDFTVFEQS